MAQTTLRRYWFLLMSILALTLGLVLQKFEVISNLTFTVGALVGLTLASKWTLATLRNKEFGSDSLAIIAIAAALSIGEFLAAAIVSLMLATGRALEDWAKLKSQRELKALLQRAPRFAHLIGEKNVSTDVELDALKIGDRIRVLNGEVVPIDGILISNGEFDESALTGEPMPVARLAGQTIASGVINSGASVELEAICAAADSTYSNLVRLVSLASADSSKSVRLANRWAIWFVPFTLTLAALAWLLSADLEIAVAVLISATPCPLILAMPVALISGMSKSASKGAIIKGGHALEHLARAKTVLLDKTGTLTHGGPKLNRMAAAPGENSSYLLQLAASLELHSPHIVARAIVEAAELSGLETYEAKQISERHGHSISGVVNGFKVMVGQPKMPMPRWAQVSGDLQVAIEIDGEVKALLTFDDPIREESLETIQNLRTLGINKIALVSGDKSKTANQVAALIGADAVFAECTPEQKLELVKIEMQASAASVVLVGDGINDAPALAAASVGVAMGARGATAASEAADVVIIEDSLKHLAIAIDISQGAFRKATQAGAFGMALAVISMLVAAFGALSPTQAAILQELIDASTILWALTPLRSRLK